VRRRAIGVWPLAGHATNERTSPRTAGAVALIVAMSSAIACSTGTEGPVGGGEFVGEELICDLNASLLADGGVGRDGIPALDNPEFIPVEPLVSDNTYLRPDDRVIAVWEGGEWLVIPHNIMWRHEIVNLPEVTVTYCPLTGSALAFARLSVSGAEFGVSGLLYQANLVLYDRNEPDESLWPQMLAEARCGPRSGQPLTRVPLVEMTWDAWRTLHPDSKVVKLPTIFDRGLYMLNPYGNNYDNPDNADYLGFPIPLTDLRLPPKARVLGIPDTEGGPTAYAFQDMALSGAYGAFEFQYEGAPAVVFWDEVSQAAMAYRSIVSAQQTSFVATDAGFEDQATGTVWAVDGTPVAGPLAGSGNRLRAISSAYVAFWGAWAAFHPGTELGIRE